MSQITLCLHEVGPFILFMEKNEIIESKIILLSKKKKKRFESPLKQIDCYQI